MSHAEIKEFDALTIPSDALEKGGIEILRASVVEGELHVTLRRAFEQPEHWGGLLSELVRRVARAYAADGKMKEADVVARIRTSFSGGGAKTKAAAKKKTAKPARAKKKKR
jgi:uncharacterized protein DUF5076